MLTYIRIFRNHSHHNGQYGSHAPTTCYAHRPCQERRNIPVCQDINLRRPESDYRASFAHTLHRHRDVYHRSLEMHQFAISRDTYNKLYVRVTRLIILVKAEVYLSVIYIAYNYLNDTSMLKRYILTLKFHFYVNFLF